MGEKLSMDQAEEFAIGLKDCTHRLVPCQDGEVNPKCVPSKLA